jgi:hypothetical protein
MLFVPVAIEYCCCSFAESSCRCCCCCCCSLVLGDTGCRTIIFKKGGEGGGAGGSLRKRGTGLDSTNITLGAEHQEKSPPLSKLSSDVGESSGVGSKGDEDGESPMSLNPTCRLRPLP